MKRLLRSPALRPHLRETLTLAVPLMLGELSSILMGVADNIMIGRLGTVPLAASGVAGAAFVMVMLIVWGSVQVLPAPVAETHERNDGPQMRALLGAGLVLTAAFSLICIAGLALVRLNFHYFDQAPSVEAEAVRYLGFLIFNLPVLVLYGVLVQYVDGFALVRWSMAVAITGLALDIGLNWIFIFGNLGAPALGLAGAAATTGFTHLAMSATLLTVLLRRPAMAYWRTARTTWAAISAETCGFLRLGLPSGLQTMVEYAAFAVGTVLIGQMGVVQQAAHQIALNLATVSYLVVLGLSTAGAIRVGQARAYAGVWQVRLAGLATMLLAVLFMIVPMLLFLLAPGWLVRWYSVDPAVLQTAVTLLVFAGLFQVADGLQSSSLTLLRALGDVRWPSAASLLAFWIVGLPLGYWLSTRWNWQASGIWAGYVVALIIQASLFARRFWQLAGRKRELEPRPE